jgi:hypothetical protein
MSGECSGGTEQCKHCGDDLDSFADAVEHHDTEHQNQRFDPLWYSEPDDWEESDAEDIYEIVQSVEAETNRTEEQ